MTEAEQQLQNALTTTFLANLAFLSEYDNELYHRVDELSRMIERGTYKEKYALEFIIESGDFDIYDIINDKYLYNKNPKKINDDMVRKVKFDEKNSIFDLPFYFRKKNKIKIDLENRFDFNLRKELVALTQNDVYEYSSALNDFLDNTQKELKKINKFIFFGTLLGRHIPKIANKVDSEIYLVLERNLEIFRLSLFLIDYTILAKKGVIFSIMDNYIEEEKKIAKFLNIGIFNNYIIKFSSTGININNYIDEILAHISNLTPVSYDYNRRLYIHINRTTQYLKKYKVLSFNNIKEIFGTFRNVAILYIAAGPSLDENIEWIRKNQSKFFIVTIGAAYKKLLKNKIRIDIITTIDEKEELNEIQFCDEYTSKIDNNTIILASTITNEKILQKVNQEKLFLFEIFTPFHKNNKAFTGFSVGEITLDILLHLNPKEIYLLGLDLALNQETGISHSEDAGSIISKLDLNGKQQRDTFCDTKSLIKVKGNLKDEVFTIPMFYASIKDAEKKIYIHFQTKNTKIFNLSINGAFIEGTIPMNIENIDITNFNDINLRNEAFNFFKNISIDHFKDDSKEILKKELISIQEVLSFYLIEIKNTSIKNFEEFLEKVFLFLNKIYDDKNLILYQFIFEYYALFLPYLSYHFNNKRIKNETKKLKKVRDVYIIQMDRLLEDYCVCLKRLI